MSSVLCVVRNYKHFINNTDLYRGGGSKCTKGGGFDGSGKGRRLGSGGKENTDRGTMEEVLREPLKRHPRGLLYRPRLRSKWGREPVTGIRSVKKRDPESKRQISYLRHS